MPKEIICCPQRFIPRSKDVGALLLGLAYYHPSLELFTLDLDGCHRNFRVRSKSNLYELEVDFQREELLDEGGAVGGHPLRAHAQYPVQMKELHSKTIEANEEIFKMRIRV